MSGQESVLILDISIQYYGLLLFRILVGAVEKMHYLR